MKSQYDPTFAAGRRPHARASLVALLLLATRLPVPGQAGEEPVFFTKITTGPVVTDPGWSGHGNWADYDNDGYPDLLVHRATSSVSRTALYHNNGNGTFTGVTNSLFPCRRYERGGSWADFNNDGRVDLWLVSDPPLIVHVNSGDGTFSPLWYGGETGKQQCVFDYDQDGFVDLFNISAWGSANWLYRNLGGYAFQAMTAAEVGDILCVSKTGGAASAADYDDDGWVDICMGGETAARLFRNDGTGRFTSVINRVTSDLSMTRAIQALWGDYDNDGRLDLWVDSYGGAGRFYRNIGGGEFECPATGINAAGDYGAAMDDFDNDGFLDMFLANQYGRNRLFHNNGNGTFAEITAGIVPNDAPVSGAGAIAATWSDYDNDGFLDLFVGNGQVATAVNFLYHNEGNDNAWLKVKPVGTLSNRDGSGAKVRAKATFAGQTRWQRRDIQTGYVSNPGKFVAHFGLGDATNVETLRIEWPSQIVQELQNVAIRQTRRVTEPIIDLWPPGSMDLDPGSDFGVTVEWFGVTPTGYQWHFKGTPIEGATNVFLLLTNVQPTQTGGYTVEMVDAFQRVISQPVRVTVYPVITRQPQSLTVTNDTPVTFAVSVTSPYLPLTYQWRFNGMPLAGQTGDTLTIPSAQSEHDGLYDVLVSDLLGSLVSDAARLTVLVKPSVTLCVTNYTVVEGGNLTLSVETRSDAILPITYLWFRIASVKSRQTNDCHRSFFTLTNIQPSEGRTDGVYYWVRLLNVAATEVGTSSDRIYLTVLPDNDRDGMDNDWETWNGLNRVDPSDADLDSDSDGLTNRQEYQCGTDPTDPSNHLKIERVAMNGEAQIEFIAQTNITYTVEYADFLADPASSTIWHTLADVVAGPARRMLVADPSATHQRLYRLVTPRQP